MEEWYAKVRDFKDESESPYIVQTFTRAVFIDVVKFLKLMPKDRKVKFKQRLGPEFEQWIAELSDLYPESMVKEIIEDDDFWELTLDIAK